MAPHTSILLSPKLSAIPNPHFSHPTSYHHHRVASIPYNYQLELAPVNNIPLNLVHTTTNWPATQLFIALRPHTTSG